ncbi:MAG: DUF1993 domain-containing protein [Rhizobiaceae bacterium]
MQSPLPQIMHSLKNLSHVLTKAEEHCEENKLDPAALLNARLYPDMFTCIRNVLVSCDTAKGTAARLSGVDNPSFEDNETTFDELQARIAKTLDFMASVPEEAFEGAEDRKVVLQTGKGEFEFTGAGYLATFAIPNFYFHVTTVYNILRHNGVPLSKVDYLRGKV